MTDDEKFLAASERVSDVLQRCVNEGLLEPGLIVDWILIGAAIDVEDGRERLVMLHPEGQEHRGAFGLLNMACIMVDEDVRDWCRDGSD
jgi:hypothetical protein